MDNAQRVDADFPGGNIRLLQVGPDTVRAAPDLRDTNRDWFHWHFRVRHAAGRTLTVEFAQDWFGPLGPAASTDGGREWNWLGRTAPVQRSFQFVVPANADDVRFAFCIPYVGADLRRFLRRVRPSPHVRVRTLARSPAGRRVEQILLGNSGRNAPHRVLLTARHHSCETTANFVLEGLMDAVLAPDALGGALREHVAFAIVPFVDPDGVETGDQGKQRHPHDHWEDYGGRSLYPEVEALRKHMPAWVAGGRCVALDVHCPSRLDQKVYLAGPRSASAAAQLAHFARLLEAESADSLPSRAADWMPFDTGWNTAAYYGQRRSFMHWVEALPGVECAGTLEVPYARVGPVTVTPAVARNFGRDLARTLARYFTEPGNGA